MSSQWTPETIRALGPTTDVPTLGSILSVSRWKAYQMARAGEWEQVRYPHRPDRQQIPRCGPVHPGSPRHRPGSRLCYEAWAVHGRPRADGRERS